MTYEVVLSHEARRIIRELSRPEKELLADGLRNELTDQPGMDTVVLQRGVRHRMPEGHSYLAHALPGFVVIYRRMTGAELAKLAAEKNWRSAPSRGFFIFDLVLAVPPG